MFEAFFKGEGFLFAPVLVVFCGALGAQVSRWLVRLEPGARTSGPLEPLERVLLDILFGSVLIGLLLYLASLIGLLRTGAYAVLLLQAIALVRGAFVRNLGLCLRSTILAMQDTGFIGAAALVFAIALMGGVSALWLLFTVQPSFDADTSTTYIWAAKQFALHGTLYDNGHAIGAMAKSGFLHLAYGLLLASPLLAHAWLVALTAAGMTLLILVLTRIGGVVAAVFLLTVVFVSGFALEAYVMPAKFDGITLAYGVAALAALARAARNGVLMEDAVLLGAFAGAATSLSYNNIIVGGLFFIAAIGLVVQQKGKFTLVLAGIAAGALAATPTYLQNLLLHSNPVYPFAGSVFPSGIGSTIPEATYFAEYIGLLREQYAISSIAELPGLLSGILTEDGLTALQAGKETWFGWTFLATLPAAMWVLGSALYPAVSRRERVDIVRLLVGAGWLLAVLSWAYTQHILRYLSFALPLGLAALAFLTCDLVGLANIRFRLAISVLLAAGSLFALSSWFERDFPKYQAVRAWLTQGPTSADYFEQSYIYGGVYAFGEVVSALNRELPPGSKILSFVNGNSYFAEGFDVYIGNGSNALPSLDGVAKPLTDFAGWQEWKAHLIAQGFDYVVVEPTYLYLSVQEEPTVRGFFAAEEPWQMIGTAEIYKL
ncbi:MAG: hypothetical protein JJ969_05550 [Rhizobiaceae bacterium]|nr:hypothetical protein [Rhizobiaceae bacterium]